MNHQDKQLSSNQLFLSVILMVAGAHLCNDLIQSMLTATYPLLEEKYRLTFAQVGCISLVYQFTASILQPVIGFYTDKHPKPYLLPLGMVSTTFGLCLLGLANQFYLLLVAAAFLGVGSSTFHPEASRVARNASAGRYGSGSIGVSGRG
ncbi:MFS transporter [Snodgrassella sp. CS2]|uniref:MFS transporter n=1 Tax=Snodgrassella sp. CS2 TaxID=3418953 RepID=UPI003CFF82BA